MKQWVARTADGEFMCQSFSQSACISQVADNACDSEYSGGVTVALEDQDHHEHIFRHLENAIFGLRIINGDLLPCTLSSQHGEPKTTEVELNDLHQASRSLDDAIQIIERAIEAQLKRKFPDGPASST